MVDNAAIHELNNIEVRGGDSDYAVVQIGGSEDEILMEYDDDTDEWDIRGTVSDLDVADLDYEFGLHQTEIDEDREIPEGQGSVIAGPLTGTGEITGDGNLAVVDDVQDAVRNPVQENVDFNSKDATGISALEAEEARIGSNYFIATSDSEFDDALSSVNDGGMIKLIGTGVITSQKTIDKRITVMGTGKKGSDNVVDSEITAANRVKFLNVSFRDSGLILDSSRECEVDLCSFDPNCTIEINAVNSSVRNCITEAVDITVSEDNAIINSNYRPDITFESGTELGVVSGNARATITDNGDNTVGTNS